MSVMPLQSIFEERLRSRHYFGTTDRSLRRLLQREKRLREKDPSLW